MPSYSVVCDEDDHASRLPSGLHAGWLSSASGELVRSMNRPSVLLRSASQISAFPPLPDTNEISRPLGAQAGEYSVAASSVSRIGVLAGSDNERMAMSRLPLRYVSYAIHARSGDPLGDESYSGVSVSCASWPVRRSSV